MTSERRHVKVTVTEDDDVQTVESDSFAMAQIICLGRLEWNPDDVHEMLLSGDKIECLKRTFQIA